LPSNHIDIAPTLLEFSKLPTEKWPVFLDGRPLQPYWESETPDIHPPPETINIEYWGSGIAETYLTPYTRLDTSQNSYKTVRIVGQDYGYMYSHWCTGETELYDSITDPYELSPLPLNTTIASRLNGLLLISKSCEQNSCRNPWKTLHPDGKVNNLKEALEDEFDAFYAALPQVAFKECLQYQLRSNEEPFYPEGLVELGEMWRDKEATDGLRTSVGGGALVSDAGRFGAKYEGAEKVLGSARELTEEELGGNNGTVV
jgi:hypothetical protein